MDKLRRKKERQLKSYKFWGKMRAVLHPSMAHFWRKFIIIFRKYPSFHAGHMFFNLKAGPWKYCVTLNWSVVQKRLGTANVHNNSSFHFYFQLTSTFQAFGMSVNEDNMLHEQEQVTSYPWRGEWGAGLHCGRWCSWQCTRPRHSPARPPAPGVPESWSIHGNSPPGPLAVLPLRLTGWH